MVANPQPLLADIGDLLRDVGVVAFDESAAEEFGKLRGLLKQQGRTVNPVDLEIAAVAIAQNLTLVTNNTRHFQNIPGLQLDDWLTP